MEQENWTIGKSCIGDSRLEIAEWTSVSQVAVHFELSNLESPMQDFPIIQFLGL